MAEGGDAEWELSKENIQPLKRGRDVSALHQALSQQQGGPSAAVNQQQQAFESELRIYNGDDPLDVWDRYVKWTEQMFPQGGKESHLATLLERAVELFTEEKRYHNDTRYIDLWIKLADISPEPLDIYRYMQAQRIGGSQTSFYIAWSAEYERQGNSRKADNIYQEGFDNFAEPRDKLLQFHKALQARVSRQVMTNMLNGESDEESNEPERHSLVDLKHRGKKKTIVPVNRARGVLGHNSRGLQSQGAPAPSRTKNSCFVVFDENKGPTAEASEPKWESWALPPPVRAKENEQKPEKWCDVKMPQRSRFGHKLVAPPVTKPNFQPFVEESDEPPTMTPCKINSVVNTVLSARKPCQEQTPLKRLQDHQHQHQQQQQNETEGVREKEKRMYCHDLLFSGATEFCFEELRAERCRQKTAQETDPAQPGQSSTDPAKPKD